MAAHGVWYGSNKIGGVAEFVGHRSQSRVRAGRGAALTSSQANLLLAIEQSRAGLRAGWFP